MANILSFNCGDLELLHFDLILYLTFEILSFQIKGKNWRKNSFNNSVDLHVKSIYELPIFKRKQVESAASLISRNGSTLSFLNPLK